MHRLKSGVFSHPDAHSEIESEIGDRKQFAEAVSGFTDLSADERERERERECSREGLGGLIGGLVSPRLFVSLTCNL